MSDFKAIAEKLLTSRDYRHTDEVNADIKKLLGLHESLEKENAELKRKLDLAVEALGFYGNSSNYESDDVSRTDGLPCYDILCFDFDRNVRGKHLAGKRARQALNEIGEIQ